MPGEGNRITPLEGPEVETLNKEIVETYVWK